MTDRNEALRLADALDKMRGPHLGDGLNQGVHAYQLAALLRQLSAERDQLRAEVERLRGGLLETARMVEDLKKPVSMDNPESPQAARNSLYMSISYFARAVEAAKEAK